MKMKKHHWLLLLILMVILNVATYFTGLWQLEMVWIAHHDVTWTTKYNLAGLGNFGFQLYTWRDIWYTILTACYLTIVIGFITLCVKVYVGRDKNECYI